MALNFDNNFPARWIEFDYVRKDEQYDTRAKRWVVTSNGREETITAIKDYGPVLHGRRIDGTEVCFSPACVVELKRYKTRLELLENAKPFIAKK